MLYKLFRLFERFNLKGLFRISAVALDMIPCEGFMFFTGKNTHALIKHIWISYDQFTFCSIQLMYSNACLKMTVFFNLIHKLGGQRYNMTKTKREHE